jgi:hypothetical protein
MSDILIMNIFETFVGLKEGGSISLLERVIQASLKMKIKEERNLKTTLLILIRDYKPSMVPLNEHIKVFHEIIKDIWKAIKKPEGEETRNWSDYFDLVIVGIRDILPKGVIEQERLKEIKDLFHNKDDENYLFNEKKRKCKEFLMGELEELFPKVWAEICLNRDLDILSQRESIAIIRCDNVRIEIMEKVDEELETLEQKVLKDIGYLERVKGEVEIIKEKAIKAFMERAPHYLENIHAMKLEELKEGIGEKEKYVDLLVEKKRFEIYQKEELSKVSKKLEKMRDEIKKGKNSVEEMEKVQAALLEKHKNMLAKLKEETDARIKKEEALKNQTNMKYEETIKKQKAINAQKEGLLKLKQEEEKMALEMKKNEEALKAQKEREIILLENEIKLEEERKKKEKAALEAERAAEEARRKRRKGWCNIW